MASDADGITAIDKLKDHYKHCIRLSNSNKINPKNAFDLQLIDYMQDLINSPENGQTNFKIASSALDVGAKIYSNRVDCIQSEAQKVASSILMALDGQNKGNDNADDSQGEQNGDTSMASDRMNDSGEVDEEGQRKSKKKRANRNKNVKTVVEKNHYETQLDAQYEEMHLSDAFFGYLSEVYDMGCPLAIAIHNAPIQSHNVGTIEHRDHREGFVRLPREPSIPAPSTSATPVPQSTAPSNSTTPLPPSTTSEQENTGLPENKTDNASAQQPKTPSESNAATYSTLHGQTASTQFTGSRCLANDLIARRLNFDLSTLRNSKKGSMLTKIDNFLVTDRATTVQGCNSNLDETVMSLGNDMPNFDDGKASDGERAFDRQMFEDGANNDYGDDHFDDANSVYGDGQLNDNNQDRNRDVIGQLAVIKPSEYVYTNENHRLIDTWAGPHAFKTAKIPLSTKKDSAPKSARKRAKLEHKPIDYEEKYSKSLEETADKDIRHSSNVIRGWKKPLLPQDHNLTEESIRATLVHAFLRPEDTYHCMKSVADALKSVDKDHDYTNNGRNSDLDEPASPGMGGFDDVHDDSDDEFRADPVVEGNEVALFGAPINNTLTQHFDLEFAGEHLIEQPVTVAQVNIPFAKIAKKMDVRKLKRVMWDLLLPPEKRAELLMMQTNNVTVVETGTHNGKNDTTIGGDQNSTTMGGDELNETVIHNGDANKTSASGTTKTPSPTPSESAVHLEFSNLYGELPVRVSTKMADDLSQPIAFVTLLHLANEKNLKLIPKQDLKDFIIEQDELL